MAYKHDDKSSGQLIRSADWNLMGHEIERLEIDKVNRAGDTIKGDLTVTGKAQFGPLAVSGDANITGKVQLGPLTVSGDVSVSGKAQLGSLAVSGDASVSGKAQLGSLAVTGNTSITSGVLQIGSLQLKGFTDSESDEWPNVFWYRDNGKNWDEGLIKHSSARGKFGRAGFGVHFHQAREFGLWSTGWDPLFAVEGGTGNAYIKGNLIVQGGQQNIIKVVTITQAVVNAGVDKPANWNVTYSGFSQIYTVFIVLQGFSIYGNNNNTKFDHWDHGSNPDWIPQHVFVRVDSFDTTTAKGIAYCSESDRNGEGDNSILFTVVVMGRGNQS